MLDEKIVKFGIFFKCYVFVLYVFFFYIVKLVILIGEQGWCDGG